MPAEGGTVPAMAIDVTEATFDAEVIEASRSGPVVVDFWAPWCAPCRQLAPNLAAAVDAREGVKLVKIDTDQNPRLAQAFGIQGIPAVKGFRDGRVAGEFTGNQPRAAIDAFIDALLPTPGELAMAAGDEHALRAALAEVPHDLPLRLALGRALLARGGDALAEAVDVLEGADHDIVGAALLARARVAADPDADPETAAALARLEDDPEGAIQALLEAVIAARDERRDALKAVLLGVFAERAADDPLVLRYRRRLASALY